MLIGRFLRKLEFERYGKVDSLYLERTTIRQIERVLVLGSALTLIAGICFLFFPAYLLNLVGMQSQPLLFIQISGLLLAILATAYLMTLLDHREKNRGILAIGFFQKLGVSVLFVAGVVFMNLPIFLLLAAGFDGVMAILFLLHLQGTRLDGWL